jgi:hypothetical protein
MSSTLIKANLLQKERQRSEWHGSYGIASLMGANAELEVGVKPGTNEVFAFDHLAVDVFIMLRDHNKDHENVVVVALCIQGRHCGEIGECAHEFVLDTRQDKSSRRGGKSPSHIGCGTTSTGTLRNGKVGTVASRNGRVIAED